MLGIGWREVLLLTITVAVAFQVKVLYQAVAGRRRRAQRPGEVTMFRGTVSFRAQIIGNGLAFPLCEVNVPKPSVDKIEVESKDGKEIHSRSRKKKQGSRRPPDKTAKTSRSEERRVGKE